jgi:uncharacterized protein YqkB
MFGLRKTNEKESGRQNATIRSYKLEGVIQMEVTLTEAAARKIEEKTAGKTGYLKLKYDTDGCGCAVNGVTALWFVSETDSEDEEIITNSGSIFVEKPKKVFLDEKMKIDFLESANCFQLKSPGEILNGRMSFLDKTKQ